MEPFIGENHWGIGVELLLEMGTYRENPRHFNYHVCSLHLHLALYLNFQGSADTGYVAPEAHRTWRVEPVKLYWSQSYPERIPSG